MITLASKRYTLLAYGTTLDSRYPLGFDPSPYDFFIGPYGSDSNDGLTTDSPWAITALETKGATIAGKQIGLLDGTYNVGSLMPANYYEAAIEIPSTSAGTVGTPTVIQSVNARGATITTTGGVNSTANSGCIRINQSATFVQIKDIAFANLNHHAIRVWGDDATISGCSFKDIGWDNSGDNLGAIIFTATTFVTRRPLIQNCVFERIRNQPVTGGDYAAQTGDNCCGVGPIYDVVDIVIEKCTFIDLLQPTYFKRNCGNYTFRYNFALRVNRCHQSIHRSDLDKLLDGGGAFTYTVGENVAHNNIYAQVGFVSYDGQQSGQLIAPTFKFYANTILQTGNVAGGGGFFPYYGDSGYSAAWSVYNNVFYQTAGGTVGNWFKRNTDATAWPDIATLWDYNGFSVFGYRDEVNATTYSTIGAWRTAFSLDMNSVVNATPLFVNESGTTAADFDLQAGSPFAGVGQGGADMGAWGGGTTQVGANFT